MKTAVTVGKGDTTGLVQNALAWASELELPYIKREGKGTLEDILDEYELDALIIATARGPEVYSATGRLFFHPGMGLLRIKNIQEGKGDRLVEAMRLSSGMSLLDCTLGLCADACVAAFTVGENGKVVGLEASLPVAFVMKEGLKVYKTQEQMVDVWRKIEVLHAEAGAYLKTLPDKSFDVVYFDPMFAQTVNKSSSIKPLHALAYRGALEGEVFDQAKRVARQRIVIKLVKYSKILPADFTLTQDGRYSKIKYAVWERE